MTRSGRKHASVRSYFVDEAGDGSVFNRKGHVIIGTEGCSRYFMLGLLDVADPEALSQELEELRTRLLADPYFKGVPSMQPEARKTALSFHAKNDLPEVRREVFAALIRADLRFFACVKDKQKVLEYVRQRNQLDPTYRYNPNELYDYMVRNLFKTLLHKEDKYRVCFARRGRSDRTKALRQALETARNRFCQQHQIVSSSAIRVIPHNASASPCLQATDYFLWALQRLYERREERYTALLWPVFRLVIDLDDQRERPYGTYYTQKKPLTLAALDKRPGI